MIYAQGVEWHVKLHEKRMVSITFIIPEIINQIGLKVELLRQIAGWLPANFLVDEVIATNSGIYDCLWNTPFGLMKCMVAGFGLVAVFMAVGLLGFRRKEV